MLKKVDVKSLHGLCWTSEDIDKAWGLLFGERDSVSFVELIDVLVKTRPGELYAAMPPRELDSTGWAPVSHMLYQLYGQDYYVDYERGDEALRLLSKAMDECFQEYELGLEFIYTAARRLDEELKCGLRLKRS